LAGGDAAARDRRVSMDQQETRSDDKEKQERPDHPQPPPAPAPEEVSDPVCAVCGHPISQDDIVCPNCGTSLVAG